MKAEWNCLHRKLLHCLSESWNLAHSIVTT